ncbi:MAG: ABC transporter substrate-binding protein [Pseudomonadota bacterium]
MTIRLAAALALSLGAAPLSAQEPETVRFGTNWVPQGEHGGYYQAVAEGLYAECGLEVEIVPGGPQVNNRARLMAGELDFYMGGNLLAAFSAVREGIPLKVVAAHFQKEPAAILTHPGAVESFEGLKSLDVLYISDLSFQSWYQWLESEHGFSEGLRRAYHFNSAPFLADPRSGQQGYVTSEPWAIEREAGFAPDIYLLADAGFSTYATTVETMEETIQGRPEVVECFVEASSIGWTRYLYGDPAPAHELIRAENPDMTEDRLAHSRAALIDYGIVDSGDARELGIGAMTDARIRGFYEDMVEAGVIEPGLDVSRAYTLEFSNTGAALAVRRELTGE